MKIGVDGAKWRKIKEWNWSGLMLPIRMRTSPLGSVSAERLQFVPKKKKSLFLFRWGVWFREQQFIVQLRLRLLWGRGVQGRVRRRPDGRRGGQSSAGADDGEGERARAVQQNWEERGPKEAVSCDDAREEKQESCCRTHEELRAEKWHKNEKQQFWKTLLVNFPRFTTTIRKHVYGRLWHFSNPLCAFNYSRLRLSVLTDLKLRRSWRRQRRRRKRRRKRSRRKSKKKGSYLRFKTHKWWVWGLFEQY